MAKWSWPALGPHKRASARGRADSMIALVHHNCELCGGLILTPSWSSCERNLRANSTAPGVSPWIQIVSPRTSTSRSKTATSMCAAKRFVSMAILRALLNSRVNCAHSLSTKASESARRRVWCDQREREWSRRAPAPRGRPCAARGRAGSTRARSRSRARTDRRHHDRDGLDDRLGDFYHFGGIGTLEWCARLVASRMGCCWFANDYRSALLLGAGDHDAARWRRLRLFARIIRKIHRVLVRLDFVSGNSNRYHRRSSNCVRKIPRRFYFCSFARQLFGRADIIWWLRN